MFLKNHKGADTYAIAVEQGVEEEFIAAYGYEFSTSANNNNPFYQDFIKLFQSLNIITNNSPDSIGGGGTPRSPLAPPLVDQDTKKSTSYKPHA